MSSIKCYVERCSNTFTLTPENASQLFCETHSLCSVITKKGTRCKNNSASSKGMCYTHDKPIQSQFIPTCMRIINGSFCGKNEVDINIQLCNEHLYCDATTSHNVKCKNKIHDYKTGKCNRHNLI